MIPGYIRELILRFQYNKTVDNSVHNTIVNNYYGLGEADIKKLQSGVQKALEINVKDDVSVLAAAIATISSNITPTSSLKITKITNNPTEEELKIIQEARGNKPYNSIFDVHIDYDTDGNPTLVSWTES